MNHLIFVTEDEDNIRELLRCTIESFGYAVECFESAEDLLERLKTTVPSLILLDIMLPGMDGLEALKKIKKNPASAAVQVLLLTAKSSEVDKVRGLDLGAEDYITKPFGVLELNARIRTALRRLESPTSAAVEQEVLRGKEITLDVQNREITLDGAPVELTLKEFDLLKILMANNNRVVERDELLNSIWGYDYVGETRTLDMHIKTLRAKLTDNADSPRFIKTVRGIGYKFIGN